MGNQLTGIAPSQIHPVQNYLSDLLNFQFEKSLGSTRFLKVALARHPEGPIVVKVFVIHDPSLPLQPYQQRVKDIGSLLAGAPNCLPFNKIVLVDSRTVGQAVLLVRQFVKYSLYDRLSTRPFLLPMEKIWIAYQLLSALQQSHSKKVCHGDVKSENVLLTSWSHVVLTDFANFKPTYLPEDNPTDFSYFFDTSRRRTCYIAPERFVNSTRHSEESTSLGLTASEMNCGDLSPSMDIFSAGCVLLELFTDGSVPFDLAAILAYRNGESKPNLENVSNPGISQTISNMLELDPAKRKSAEEILAEQKGKLFPTFFYDFLQAYLGQFASCPILSPDERICRIEKDFDGILEHLNIQCSDDKSQLVLIVSLVTCNVCSLNFLKSKLLALDLLVRLSSHLPSDIILDRILPFLLEMLRDSSVQVQAESIHSITCCLKLVKQLPVSDANIFLEYIMPQLNVLVQDSDIPVRVAFAANVAELAEIARNFLEQLQNEETERQEGITSPAAKSSHDAELTALHEAIQHKVVMLLTDTNSVVKRTLLRQGITRLCVFFGRQKASDVLLSHMITFLNDKSDWHLRAAFFDSIVGVAIYLGWPSSKILQPLIEQGLFDPEEFVIWRALVALSSLTRSGLVIKSILYQLLDIVLPLFFHPNIWIRQAAVGYISSLASVLNVADVHCRLLPKCKPFLAKPVVQMDKPVILLEAMMAPLSTSLYQQVLHQSQMPKLLKCFDERRKVRELTRVGRRIEQEHFDTAVEKVLEKLLNLGMTEEDELKFVLLRSFLLKLHSGLHTKSVDASSGRIMVLDHDVLKHASLHEQNRATSPGSAAAEEIDEGLLARMESPAANNSAILLASSDLDSSSQTLIHAVTSPCKKKFEELITTEREEFWCHSPVGDCLDETAWENRPPPSHWKPKGILAAHLHEHRGAVNRVLTNADSSYFITCSDDGTLKMWNSKHLTGKKEANRACFSYGKMGGQVKRLAFCQNDQSFAAAADNGIIHIIRPEASSPQCQLIAAHQLDVATEGVVTDLQHYDAGSQSLLCFSSSRGCVYGWDLRSKTMAWNFKNKPSNGLITALQVNPQQYWLCTGTSSGTHVIWDVRFQLPVITLRHPAHSGVRRLLPCSHVSYPALLSAVVGNNEVSFWNLETSERVKTLWASTAPPLSKDQASSHSVFAMYYGCTDSSDFLLTGGTDMRLRFWNLTSPKDSSIICGSASDLGIPETSYSTKLIDGTEIVVESSSKSTNLSAGGEEPRRGLMNPPVGHKDVVTDICLLQAQQSFIISTASNGVVKVWK